MSWAEGGSGGRGGRRRTYRSLAALEQEGEVRAAAGADALGPEPAVAEALLVEERLEALEDEERRRAGPSASALWTSPARRRSIVPRVLTASLRGGAAVKPG